MSYDGTLPDRDEYNPVLHTVTIYHPNVLTNLSSLFVVWYRPTLLLQRYWGNGAGEPTLKNMGKGMNVIKTVDGTTTNISTRKPCAYLMGYTVCSCCIALSTHIYLSLAREGAVRFSGES